MDIEEVLIKEGISVTARHLFEFIAESSKVAICQRTS